MEIIFGGLMFVGVGYLILTILGVGDVLNVDVDGALESTGIDGLFGVSDPTGLGCSIIAAFLTGFGSLGLAGTLAGWSAPIVILLGLAVGYAFGRFFASAMRFLKAQESPQVSASLDDLIGQSVRVTLEAQPGETGEAIVERGEVARYPIREANSAPLKRGDIVEVVEVQGRFLIVKKKRI